MYKSERIISSPQSARVRVADRQVINLCANNYLELADAPELVTAAKSALDRYGYGMASVRFICGTQEPHKALEAKIADFLGMEDQSFMPTVLTPIPVCLKRCWGQRMLLFPTR